eukprot:343187_1
MSSFSFAIIICYIVSVYGDDTVKKFNYNGHEVTQLDVWQGTKPAALQKHEKAVKQKYGDNMDVIFYDPSDTAMNKLWYLDEETLTFNEYDVVENIAWIPPRSKENKKKLRKLKHRMIDMMKNE